MQKSKLFFRLALSILLSSLLTAALEISAEVVDRVVSSVNGEPILQSDLSTLAADVKKPGRVDDSLFLSGMTLENLAKDRKQQLDYLINETLMAVEIKSQNLTATPDRVEQELTTIARGYNLSLDEFLKKSEAQGVNIAESRKFIKLKIEKQALLDKEILSKMRISDDELYQEYLRRHPKAPQQIVELKLAQIFFNPKKDGEAATQERADLVMRKLDAGESFEAMADQYSQDRNFSKGGLLGSFKTGEFIPELEDKIHDVKVGGHTSVLRSRKGLHIVKVLERNTTRDSQFEKEKESIRGHLTEIEFRKQLTSWLMRKREEAQITSFN